MAGRKDSDETVVLRRSAPQPRRFLPIAIAAGIAVVAAGGAAWWFLRSGPPVAVASTARSIVLPRTNDPPPPPAVQPAVLQAPSPPPSTDVPIRVADEATILADDPQALTAFRFSLNPAIIVIDFPTLAQQGQMLNRIAVFVEKAGIPHDRVLDDAALDAAIRGGGDSPDTFYYGHDYRAADILRFFALADRDKIVLGPQEIWLRGFVRQLGWGGPEPKGALISVPKLGADTTVDIGARRAILHHELSHGEYFTNTEYAAFTRRFWTEAMSESDRTTFRAFLARDRYDSTIEDLMMNEMQAYMMHTRDPRFFSAEVLGMKQDRLDMLRTSFLLNMPSGWLRDCTPGIDGVIPVRAPRRRRRRQGLARISSRTARAVTRAPRRRALSIAI